MEFPSLKATTVETEPAPMMAENLEILLAKRVRLVAALQGLDRLLIAVYTRSVKERNDFVKNTGFQLS